MATTKIRPSRISVGTGVETFLTIPSSVNLASAVTDETGSGALVFANTPTLVTPVLGVATATSVNKVAITAPATSATLTLANGKTLTVSNTLTFTGTDSSSVALGGGGTAAYTDVAQIYTKAQRSSITSLTSGTTITPDFSLSNDFNLVLGHNATLAQPTNLVSGQKGVITVRQDLTGSRTMAFAWPYIFNLGIAIVLSTPALSLDQLYYSVNKYSTATVTITIATPGVVTWTAHGLATGDRIRLSTSGTLPTGLVASTTYWVTVIDANSFSLSTSFANAQAGTLIATSGTQSGTHTATSAEIVLSANLSLA